MKSQGYVNPVFIEAYRLYKLSSYNKALKVLKKAKGLRKTISTRFYLEGIILNKLQRFDESLLAFKKAIKYGNRTQDIYYEYGQALYANNDLRKARKVFGKSKQTKFKKNSSLYYMAYISQLLEEHKKAKKYYKELIKSAKGDKSLKQIARFQLSESYLALMENKDDASRLVQQYVIPALKRAFDTLPKTPLAKDITKRRKEIEKRFGLDPNILKNGRILSSQRFSAGLRHQFSWDSNITLATDVPTAASTQRDSFIHTTNANFQRLWQIAGVFTFTPFLRMSNSYYTDRQTPNVFTNDTHTWSAGVRTTHEHTLFNRQANTLFDSNYTYTGRDTNKVKDNIFFAREINFTIGERVRFSNTGPTTFKMSFKDYSAYVPSIFNRTYTFSIDQIKGLSSGNLLIFLLNASFIDQVNNSNGSTNNYLTRLDYLIPEIYPTYSLNLGLSLSLLDTKEQRDSRGMEKNVSPTIEMRKSINSHISASLGYDFSRNISKNKELFDYKKHVIRFELSANY